METMGKATIYRLNELFGNIVKLEVRRHTVERTKYAQYENALKITYLGKGKRRYRQFVETHKPHVLILAGHGHPDPAGMFDGGRDLGGGCTQAKHRAFDGGYAADFDAMIGAHIKRTGAQVLLDARGEHIS